jgi:hypothetical protein
MLWRIPARLVTGPLAFLVAGAIDIALFSAAALREALRRRLRRSKLTGSRS